MDQVVQALALLAMAGAVLFGVLALVNTGRWAARWLRSIRTHHPRQV